VIRYIRRRNRDSIPSAPITKIAAASRNRILEQIGWAESANPPIFILTFASCEKTNRIPALDHSIHRNPMAGLESVVEMDFAHARSDEIVEKRTLTQKPFLADDRRGKMNTIVIDRELEFLIVIHPIYLSG
jgi:hypothetical protein